MIVDEIITMLSFEFMQRAFIGGIIFAITAPLIGYYMVLRGYSGISDGISHIALIGLAAGLIIGANPTPVAFAVTIGISFCLEYLRQKKVLRAETSITLFIVFSLAIVTIVNQQYQFTRSLDSLLFGSLTTIRWETIAWSAGVLLLTSGFILLKYNKLISLTLSEDIARLSGVPVIAYNYILIALVSMVVVIGIDVVGGLLVGSLMIVPIAASLQYSLGFKMTHIVSIIISIFSVIIGLLAAWFIDLPPGGSIALTSVLIFFVSYGMSLVSTSVSK
jgi:zinc transport system permease protein